MPGKPDYRLLAAGDTALAVEFGDHIDRHLNDLVLALDARLRHDAVAGVLETVPTFRSLIVHYEPLVVSYAALTAVIEAAMRGLPPVDAPGRRWRLPVCYDASMAPDLDDVAARTGLTPVEVIEYHCRVSYHVYMLGFLPGQPYMGDVPAELALPRRPTPRVKIPAGSLAIATTMTCIFPRETPCGWHLIGRSPVPLWDAGQGAQPLLAPGDSVQFVPVSLREYEICRSQFAAGDLSTLRGDRSLETAA